MNYSNAAGGGFLVATGGAVVSVGAGSAGMGTVVLALIGAVLGSALIFRFATRRNRINLSD